MKIDYSMLKLYGKRLIVEPEADQGKYDVNEHRWRSSRRGKVLKVGEEMSLDISVGDIIQFNESFQVIPDTKSVIIEQDNVLVNWS